MAIVGIGTFVFGLGSACGLIAATKAVEHVSDTPEATVKLSEDYPRFNALVYSLDMFVPLLDLHQANYWLPSSERGRSLGAGFMRFSTGGTLRLYLGVHIYLGLGADNTPCRRSQRISPSKLNGLRTSNGATQIKPI